MMRKHAVILMLIIFSTILIACQPVQTAIQTGGGQNTPVGTQTPKNEGAMNEQPGKATLNGNDSSDGETLSFGGEQPVDNGPVPRPEVAWDGDPATLVLSGTFCCGFTPELVRTNYIPDVQIWGDGRMIWVRYNSDGSRNVQVTQLTSSELEALLQKFVDAGFFGWKDRYMNPMVADAADQCLAINLKTASKSVCEYVDGAPQAFHDLYDFMAGGAGKSGQAFIPQSGYLVTYLISGDLQIAPEDVNFQWEADRLGFSLGAATKGTWVEGEPLQQVWEAVNMNPWGVVIQDGDNYYRVSLQIPGVSMEEPPAR